MLIKQESITSNKLGSRDLWQIANSVLNKCKFAIPPLFNGWELLSSASDKAKFFAENFSVNSNLDDSGIFLPVFPSRTNLKLHNISVTPKMVRKVVMNLDLYVFCMFLNSCMLEQISYLGEFWFLRCGPKCSWPIKLQDFSINLRTLKLAVSHKEIHEINWFLVCLSNSFLRNGSLGFSDFWHNGR